MGKKNRHTTIKEIILSEDITNQDMLLNALINKGFDVTQATLSRDIKELKIIKAPTSRGSYAYQLADAVVNSQDNMMPLSSFGFLSIEFSGQLAVIKTRPGYAMAIAGEIDSKANQTIIGTVAGDDTILLIPKDNISREEVLASLSSFIPNMK
ncbi:arginine repressor [Dysgonomonas sp. HDW5B]|uniref:arginine repressor n=1 Tax=Dysgonomonas sp. HDW5B TaxID=2714927 RepID=UPI001409366A|nr:arginine repressor [Dysgonomonas sp. HDW5B]QIK55801.1 arginine repressor [Dysgonomonas sp. HDW5B]